MSERTDKILELLDGALQTPLSNGIRVDHHPGRCARCQKNPPRDDKSSFCGGCRAFLLDDTDEDPKDKPAGNQPTTIPPWGFSFRFPPHY